MVDDAVLSMEQAWQPPRGWVDAALVLKALAIGAIVAILCPMLILGYKHYYFFKGLPDFQSYRTTSERKEAFIRFMVPMVQQANSELRMQQRRMVRIYSIYAGGGQLNDSDTAWILALAQQYGVKDFTLAPTASAEFRRYAWELMFRRVDTIPVSLVLAQAANESAWGTSRFAREGRNLFGEWCFVEGCGIKPARRDEGKTHEVKSFSHVYDSIRSYMHNLNTNDHYAGMRDIRVDMRRRGELLDGEKLVDGLGKYSELGKKYIEIIRSVIQNNGLEQYDEIQSAEKDHNKLSS